MASETDGVRSFLTAGELADEVLAEVEGGEAMW